MNKTDETSKNYKKNETLHSKSCPFRKLPKFVILGNFS